MTCRRCAGWNASCSARATWPATAATWSSRRRRSAGSATPPCAGSSPAWRTGCGPATTTASDAGQAGDTTGATREWEFGDEQPIDVPGTVRSALLRSAAEGVGRGRVRLTAEDFRVAETERRSAAAVCLLVDLSYSMALRGTWAVAKQTALALHALLRSKYPQDAIQVVGFSNYAGSCTRPSWPGSAGTWCRAPTCTTR